MCEVIIDKQPSYPGQTITGRVECLFTSEKKIKSVQVTFEGNAHVQFGTKNPIVKDEKYCNLQLNVMKDNNVVQCPPGRYTYEFSFVLPNKLPATITLDHGYVSYWITAVVDFVGEKSMRDRKKVAIGSYLDLNAYSVCKNPIAKTEDKNMILMFCKSPALTIDVKLPQGGYVPSQTVSFTAKVQNLSNVNVSAVRFKLVQVFKMVAHEYQQQQCKALGKEQDVANSNVAPGTGKSWDVQLRIPPDTLAPDLMGCNIIKMHCEVIYIKACKMGELCEVILEKEVYRPGDTINGKVVCHFTSDTEVKGIRASARGRAKVFWKEGRSNVYHAEEVFFLKESQLADDTTYAEGYYDYPFTFALPNPLPSTMMEELGNIKYSVLAVLERPWAINYEFKKVFTILTCHDIDAVDDLKEPVEIAEEKRPFSLFDESGPVIINVKLPKKGFLPSQSIDVTAKVVNNSNINVEKIDFTTAQGFEFNVKGNAKSTDSLIAEEVEVEDSAIAPGDEKSCTVKVNIPADMFNGSLNGCGIIKVFWELRGEVHLPFPYNNFTVSIPFILGGPSDEVTS